jgi:hypothetical protein
MDVARVVNLEAPEELVAEDSTVYLASLLS